MLMTMYRYVTPTRTGKWYPSIEAAQKTANKIGAGFWDEGSGAFYQYPQAKLEARPVAIALPMVANANGRGDIIPMEQAA